MRLSRLDLTRFGLFTDTSMDLSAPGVHVILGHNEAGKSTAMTAIEQLLYGIPLRTTHAFHHEMRDLRIAALLENSEGDRLEIVRVKKRSNTLQDADGNTRDEATLARLLHDVSEEVYTSLFTIGHDEIEAGGEALLDSDGEVGRALFSASRGTTDLTAVMRKLDDRAAELFKSSASKPLLNAAMKAYKEATATSKELSRSASSVVGLDEELAAAEHDQEDTAARRRDVAGRKTLMTQVRAARPLLVRRTELLQKRAGLEAEGPIVDVQRRDELNVARALRKDGESARRSARADVKRLDEKLVDLTLDTVLLDQREKIDRLTRQTGGYDQNEQDLPGIETKATTLERELDQLRKRLPENCALDENGRSVLSVDQEERIRQLASSRAGLDGDVKHADEALSETKRSAATQIDVLAGLDEPADVTALVEVASRVRKTGDLEATRTEATRELETLDAELAGELTALGLADIDLRAVDALIAPTVEVIRSARDDLDIRKAATTRVDDQIKALESEVTATEKQLTELLRSEEPLTVDDLAESRSRRDEGWQLIRGAWIHNTDDEDANTVWSAGKPLPDAYEDAVEDADGVADRLRREAEAVERRASLEQHLARLTTEIEKLTADREALDVDTASAEAAWVAIWEERGITPGSPTDMERWHDDFRTCAQRSEQARAIDGQISDLDTTIGRHRDDLVATLTSVGEVPVGQLSLLGLLDHADQITAESAAARQKHEAARTAVAETEALLDRRTSSHDAAAASMTEWSAGWSTAVTAIGLAADASPSEAGAVLDSLRDIETSGKRHEELDRRITGIKERSQEFTEGVGAVLASLDAHADLAEADPAAAVKMLSRRVTDAESVATTHAATTDERETQETAAGRAGVQVAEAEQLIDDMVTTARVADETELLAAIARSEEHTQLGVAITEIEENLRDQAGKPLTQVEAEAADLDSIELEPEIEQLDIELEVIDQQLKDRQTTVGGLQTQRAQIDSSGKAADLMTKAQQSLAEVMDHADEYVQVMLARQLLEEQVTAYRDENQGPLLSRARELFRSLTIDRYRGIDTDTDDKGAPFILAQKADDKLLTVDELSTGTRDQLYLALRLAALEQFMERRGPLPLVLDDLFVHFDDQRTEAGLRVLDTLAAETQILLFSHHQQVAHQAEAVIGADRLTVHELR